MSRVIKFRGIATVNDRYNGIKVGDFVYGAFIETNIDCQILFGDGEQISVDRKTVGQYTGLKDKSGVEICEGDIVSQRAEWNETEYFDGGYSDSNSRETETIGVVKIYPSKGVVITRCKKLDIIACDDNWEKTWDCNVRSCRATVIGNIHQNPELLSD